MCRRSLLTKLLLSALGLGAAACARSGAAPPATAVPPPADFDAWNTEAHGILSDTLQSLRTYDVLHAFRVTAAADSSTRPGSELVWDPPTSAAWDEATHVTRGVRPRAELLFQAVTTARIDTNLWREQRTLADATHDLVDLAESLGAYRDRVDVQSPGDPLGALGLLDKAWVQWDAVAARWGMSRSESMPCTN
jgi:hypothetical protein